jgi:hypothetical protein
MVVHTFALIQGQYQPNLPDLSTQCTTGGFVPNQDNLGGTEINPRISENTYE